MSAQLPRSRDRWVVTPRSKRPVHTIAGAPKPSLDYDDYEYPDGGTAASYFIEDIYDDSPIPTGILDEYGFEICRIPHRDTVPIGFHYKPEQYDRYGDFLGDDPEVMAQRRAEIAAEERALKRKLARKAKKTDPAAEG
jgi:hypothetical protein